VQKNILTVYVNMVLQSGIGGRMEFAKSSHNGQIYRY